MRCAELNDHAQIYISSPLPQLLVRSPRELESGVPVHTSSRILPFIFTMGPKHFKSLYLVLLAAATLGNAGKSSSGRRQVTAPTCNDSTEAYSSRVGQAIEGWRKDIQAVNSFLDTPYLEPTSPYHAAAVTANSAVLRQSGYLNTLTGICTLNAPGTNSPFSNALTVAADTAHEVYLHIGEVSSLTNGIPGPGDVEGSLETISELWCCHLLPAADALWQPSMKKYGLVGSTSARFGEAYPVPYAKVCGALKC
jgi:hypothetical protein